MKPIEEMGKCRIFWMDFWTKSAQLKKQGSQPIIAITRVVEWNGAMRNGTAMLNARTNLSA